MIARALRDERGVILPLVALMVVGIIGATSLTVDVGRLANRQRELQAVADLIALDAGNLLHATTLGEVTGGDVFIDEVAASAARNGFVLDGAPAPGVVDAGGAFAADTGSGPTNGYRIGTDDEVVIVALGRQPATAPFEVADPAAPADAVDAVKVWVADRVEYVFGVGGTVTSRSAVGQSAAATGIGMTTSLGALQGGALADAVLAGLLDVDVDVVSSAGVAGAAVTLGDLATELRFGSVTSLLAAEVAVVDLLRAQAAILRAGGTLSAAADALDLLAGDAGIAGTTVQLGRIVAVATGAEAAAVAAAVEVLTLLSAVAMLAGQGRAVSLGAATGIADVRLHVVEPPQLAFGGEHTTVETAQVELVVTPDGPLGQSVTGNLCGHWNSPASLNTVLAALGCPVFGLLGLLTGLNVVQGTILAVSMPALPPITLTVGGGRSTVASIGCAPGARTVDVDATFSGVAASVGAATISVTALNRTTTITLPDLGVSGLTSGSPQRHRFDEATFGTPRSVSRSAALTLTSGSAALTSDLGWLGDLTVSGIAATSWITNALTNQVLAPLSAALDGILQQLDVALGLQIANAEVVAFSPTCDLARLAA